MIPETPETQPESSPQHLLQNWIGGLPFQLLFLEKVLLPDDFPFDYSPESLAAMETHLLEHDDSVQDPEKRAEFAEKGVAYLGEVLLGIAGGSWGWNTRPVGDLPGQPVLCPDPELELSPIAPMLLMSYALRVRTGTAFAEEVERLRAAVAGKRQEVPGWNPVKEHTPVVDPKEPLPEHPALTSWLAAREEAVAAWAEDAFEGAWRWNFHPDTLDWLEVAVRRRFATVEEFDAARDEPFVQGACWYMGEVIRRNKGAVWQYVPYASDAEPGSPGSRENAWTEVPFVDQPDKRVGGSALPLGCLRALLLQQAAEEKESLRETLFWFRPPSYAYVGALLQRMGMVPRERVDSVLAEYAEWAHEELPPHEVPSALEAFGMAVSAHSDDVDDLEESYKGILERAAALTEGAVTITDVRLREDEEQGEILEFAANGVLVTQQTDHQSDEYLDQLAVMEFIGHVDPDPAVDPRHFHVADSVHLTDGGDDNYFVFASPEQATVLEKRLGLQLH